MRALSWSEIEDILFGAAVLGCGGGGWLDEGRVAMQRIYELGHRVQLAAPAEISPHANVVCAYGAGAMTAGDEDVLGGRMLLDEHPGVLAVRALSDQVGHRFDAVICGEIGATSVADAFVPAAVLGLPVIDADPVGRAVPEIEHTTFYLHDLPIAPRQLSTSSAIP